MKIKKACALAIVLSQFASPAQAAIIDCKVILCLPAGFPAGCADAKAYMLKRLKKRKSPFGICEGSGIGSTGIGGGGLYCASGVVYRRGGGGRDEPPVEYSCDRWFGSRPTHLNYGFKTRIGDETLYFYGNYNSGFSMTKDKLYRQRTIYVNTRTDDTGNNR